MMTLTEAKATLHSAETLLAKLTGEQDALIRQVQASEQVLHTLGIDPSLAEAALTSLDGEIAALERQLQDAQAQLEEVMVG